jgi:pilus assembly protein Flp/PilA
VDGAEHGNRGQLTPSFASDRAVHRGSHRISGDAVVGVPRERGGMKRWLEARIMSKALNILKKFRKDEEGAALIEYTVLLGILVVAVIATIIAVGTWVNGQWTALNTAIQGN